MKKKTLIFIIFFMLCSLAYTADREKFNWEENRQRYKVGEADTKIPAVILKDNRVVEYIFEPGKGGQEEFVAYRTFHKIILVNTDEAIDQYNKVYIPVQEESSLVEMKARSISKTGKVTLFDKKNLKEVKSEENSVYKIFAIEGLEPGSEIEYFYTIRKEPNIFGRETIQGSIPSRNVSVQVISPEHLEFDAKVYNKLPSIEDTILNEKRFLVLKVDSIPGAIDEEYAPYDANLKRMDYKLSYNHDRGKARMYTWAFAAQRIFEQTYTFTPAELSKVKRLVKSNKFASLPNDEAKIKAVENYIKSNFVVRNIGAPQFNMVDNVIANKFGQELGITRLFAAIFGELGIDHRLVLTTDRSEAKFDGKFDTWNYLDKTIFYFPALDKYLAPAEMATRLGMVPYHWTSNDGLFIKKVKLGDTESSVSEVKFIPALPAESSPDNIYATVTIADDLASATVHAKRVLGGYNAVMFQPYYKRLDADKQLELNEELLQFISKDADITNIKVENTDPNESLIAKPFIIEGDMKLTSLIENAGNKYLFKLGDVIGKQSELYSDKKRVNDVENDFNRVYMREIKVKIPEGYKIKNPDEIKINVTCELDGKKAAGFISDYKMEGNMLIVSINEYYSRIDFPLESYEPFRKVINAAADFNKVGLILEKK